MPNIPSALDHFGSTLSPSQRDDPRSAERLPLDESREHVVESEHGDPRSDVRESVRQHELAGVDHAAARVDDVGHVPVTLVLYGEQKRLVQMAEDPAGILGVEEDRSRARIAATDPLRV